MRRFLTTELSTFGDTPAHFQDRLTSGINNAPIPSYLIEKFAGKKWIHHEIASISAIDELIRGSAGSGSLQINATNLILLLLARWVYADYACIKARPE